MEEAASINRAGDKETRKYTENAVVEEELAPFLNITATNESGKDVKSVEQNELSENNSQQDLSPVSLRQNYSNLTLSIPNQSPNSSPIQRRHSKYKATEKETSNRNDNVSINLSDYQLPYSQEQSLPPSKSPSPERSILRSRRNMSDVTIDLNSSKSNTPVPPVNDVKDDDEQILETLRLVIRKCTNPEANKRPTSEEISKLFNYQMK